MISTRQAQRQLTLFLLTTSVVLAYGCAPTPEPTIQGDTATVKLDIDVNTAQLFSTAHDLGTAIYRAAVNHPEVKNVVGVIWMHGGAVDEYGKSVNLNEELGRIERDAEEIRKYASEDAFMNRQIDPLQAEVLQIARQNGRGLFSKWKL